MASDSTVLAPFRGESFGDGRIRATFLRRDGKFLVRNEGADGQDAEFTVTHTFGLFPLQQYLVEMPGGRLQAFTVAWDTRDSSADGRRWYSLYPNDTLGAGDPLHWTGYLQNWNLQCADCHSTDLRKNYTSSAATYRTTASEDGVGCEACHGPASAHVAWAAKPALFRKFYGGTGLNPGLDERRGITWTTGATSSPPARSAPRTTDREIDTCARCHSLRSQFSDSVSAASNLHDGFRVSLLEPGRYFADGQMLDEVYSHASFLQSRMYASGVTCADCHDAHTQTLRAPGNAVCAQCHDAASYDASTHTLHLAGSTGASCVECHMPTRVYMGVDARHDHSFRIPRPDRTLSLGVPNPCDKCHADRGASWAAAAIASRKPNGARGYQAFAETFAALERGDASAAGAALAIVADGSQPAIVRASALDRLRRVNAPSDGAVLVAASRDPSPLVRRAAAAVAASAPDAGIRLTVLVPLLTDDTRAVRIEAVGGLDELPENQIPEASRVAFTAALEEYRAAQRFNADRPEALVNLATSLGARGDAAGARAAFREAMTIDRTFTPAYVNLAELERATGNEAEAERLLREAMVLAPESGVAPHALGLSLIRQRKPGPALEALKEAVRREPENARFAYVYAVALHDTGDRAAAIQVLESAAARHPGDAAISEALAAYRQKQ